MEANLENELKSFRDLAEKFARKELEPDVLERDRYPFEPFNDGAWEKAVEVGLATITLPETFGGSGQGMRALAAVLERIARVDAGTAALLMSQALAQAVVAELAPENVAKKILDASSMPIIATSLYDLPDDLQTSVTAVKQGDEYVLDGWAPYLAAAPVARAFLVPARLGDSDELALFLLEKDAAGLEVAEPAVSLGLRTLPAADVGCDSVKVSEKGRLDLKRYPAIVDRFRVGVTSMALGLVAGSYQTALDYAQERYQAKKHIIEHDQVRMMLTGMASLIDVGSPLVAHACHTAESGGDMTELLSIQTHFTNSASRAATDGVQLLGGYGYMHDYGQEKRMRDAKQIQAVFGPAAVKNLDILSRKLSR